jgi:hypothetical protein
LNKLIEEKNVTGKQCNNQPTTGESKVSVGGGGDGNNNNSSSGGGGQ